MPRPRKSVSPDNRDRLRSSAAASPRLGAGREADGGLLKPRIRCAVYTRKSSEEGLEQEFNSLDAQREACEAYIASQKQEGWVLVPDYYDDGGHSGGTLERPALQRLLADIGRRRIDVVVVYKIDRLSRSLMDFAKLVDVFDRNKVTFVSITQSFNTTTSMGRLTLNILLSFAQFEREVIGERIRDKFAASRRKGMWMGGNVPLGYQVKDRRLIINESEAKIVRLVFENFARLQSATKLATDLRRHGIRTKSGKLFDKGSIYKLLNNRVYIGQAVHKGQNYPGEHKAIIEQRLWDRVHAILQQSPRKRAATTRSQTPALLKGLIFGPNGEAMSPTHTRKGGKLYRYYISQHLLKGRTAEEGQGAGASGLQRTNGEQDAGGPSRSHSRLGPPIRRVPAGEIEAAVIAQMREHLKSPEVIAGTWRQVQAFARQHADNGRRSPAEPGFNDLAIGGQTTVPALTAPDYSNISENDVRLALQNFEKLLAELFPVEQARIVSLLVERIDIGIGHADIKLRVDGLASVVGQLVEGGSEQELQGAPPKKAPGGIRYMGDRQQRAGGQAGPKNRAA
jgi:site-specific DNA recombinase